MTELRTPEEAEVLVHAHRSLVTAVARKSFPTRQEDPELIQCGLIGLWQAALGWDGSRPFPTYAWPAIHNAMTDSLRRAAIPAEEGPLDETVPAPESHLIEDLALRQRITSVWPAGSRERKVLLALSGPVSKRDLALSMGLTTAQVTRLARRAWACVPSR